MYFPLCEFMSKEKQGFTLKYFINAIFKSWQDPRNTENNRPLWCLELFWELRWISLNLSLTFCFYPFLGYFFLTAYLYSMALNRQMTSCTGGDALQLQGLAGGNVSLMTQPSACCGCEELPGLYCCYVNSATALAVEPLKFDSTEFKWRLITYK